MTGPAASRRKTEIANRTEPRRRRRTDLPDQQPEVSRRGTAKPLGNAAGPASSRDESHAMSGGDEAGRDPLRRSPPFWKPGEEHPE